MGLPKQLQIPAVVLEAKGAAEIARLFVANDAVIVVLSVDHWKDPAPWGIALADLARHLGRAYEQSGGPTQQETLARIKTVFDAEWGAPTDTPKGGLV